MSTAVELDTNNTVVKCIEIEDKYDDDCCEYINNILNIPGVWISGSTYEKKMSIYGEPIRPTIGSVYIPEKDVFIHQKPFENWILDDNYMWVPPVKNNLRNLNFGYESELSAGPRFSWSQERNKWFHNGIEEFILKENERDSGLFWIQKCIKNNYDYRNASDYMPGLNVLCNPRSYNYIDAHPDFEEGFEYSLFRETYGVKYGITRDNPDMFHTVERHLVIYDGAPYFFIGYNNLCDLNKKRKVVLDEYKRDHLYEVSPELEAEHIRQHPQVSARTLGELFRLIIDWDLAYHYFENRENTAVVCHDILSSINMPDNIYESIISSIAPSPVSRYIMNDEKALYPGDRCKTPNDVVEWLAEKYWDLRYLKYHEELNINLYTDNHYYK